MKFKKVKFKLNLLYTGSLLFILIIFILILYIFISKAIHKQEVEELERYYKEENHEFIEDIYKYDDEFIEDIFKGKHKKRFYEEDDDEIFEDHHKYKKSKHIEYRPERNLFYYLFDSDYNLIEGEETINNFDEYLEKFGEQNAKTIKETEWENAHVLFIYYPIEMDGKKIGSVIIGKNITDEKHLIQRIIWILLILAVLFGVLFALAGNFFAGQAMKPILDAFEKQRKFVSDASHELRTPLSVFYSALDLLSTEEKEKLSPFGQQVLEDAKHETELMHKLLDDLLFLARSNQDRFELELEELDLSSLITSLLSRFKRNLPQQIALLEDIQDGVSMKGDKARIEQLLYILLENAKRYTIEGTITCTLKAQEEKIEISVKDTGIGISKKDLEHIFERFYRGDKARKRNGTGLGLAIAQTIVQAHGGKIEAKSEEGKGTEFIITFYKNKIGA